MTGCDFALIVVLIGFALLGLKHGSVWIASCLAGGFIGALFSSSYYQLPVAEQSDGAISAGAKIDASLAVAIFARRADRGHSRLDRQPHGRPVLRGRAR